MVNETTAKNGNDAAGILARRKGGTEVQIKARQNRLGRYIRAALESSQPQDTKT
jgi:hypothetical protein